MWKVVRMNNRSTIPPDASPTEDRRPKRWQHARGRRLALASLVSVILLATLWSVASVSGAGFFGGEKVREASAQTPGEDQQEIGQNDPADGGSPQNNATQDSSPQTGDSDTAGYNEEAYAAFGDERNPFKPVLSQAIEAGAGTGEDGPEGGDGGGADADANTDDTDADANTGGGPNAEANTGGGTGDRDNGTNGGTGGGGNGGADGGGGNGPSGQGGEDMVTAPNGEMVDCSDTGSDFERIICEEERQAGDNDSGDTTQGPQDGSGQQGPPGSGGSGRSGAGDTADDFRNGGGGVSK